MVEALGGPPLLLEASSLDCEQQFPGESRVPDSGGNDRFLDGREFLTRPRGGGGVESLHFLQASGGAARQGPYFEDRQASGLGVSRSQGCLPVWIFSERLRGMGY